MNQEAVCDEAKGAGERERRISEISARRVDDAESRPIIEAKECLLSMMHRQ